MKKLFALLLSVLMFASLGAIGVFAEDFIVPDAYKAPTVADALTVIKSILSNSTDLAYDVNNDGTLSLRDALYSVKRILWASELPANENTQLFGTSTSSDKYTYNYCPSIMEDENGNLHVYYCTNKGAKTGTFIQYMTYIDYIGYRKGTLQADGSYSWSSESIVLSPSASGNWDDKHNCDPSVIKGAFEYSGTTYSYLMSYLGCTDGDINDIGLAVANAPEGPWVKVGTTPIVDYTYNESSTNNWGVGQSSIVNQGGADSGKVWLFYTRGDINGTRTIICDCDFSDLDNPVVGKEIKLENAGLKKSSSSTARDFINNADFAFDDERGVLYATSDGHPHPTDTAPTFIAGAFRVTSLRFGGSDLGEITYKATPTNRWKTLATIGKNDTGFARNHNTGLVRDEYGHTTDANYLTVFYTVSEELDSYVERTYRIHSMSIVK